MNAVSKILGESEPEFSPQFTHTLALIGPLRKKMSNPRHQGIDNALSLYVARYGSSALTDGLNDCLSFASDVMGSEDNTMDWAMEMLTDFLYNFIQAVKKGEIPVTSLADSILSGHALDNNDLDLALPAIAKRAGWTVQDLEGFTQY
jgi:hypothetical protein